MNELTKQTNDLATGQFDPTLLAGQVRPSTISMYRKAYNDYTAFAGSWQSALEPATLAKWRNALVERGLSPNTINRMLSSIRAVMKAASEQGYISNDLATAFEAVKGVKVGAMRDKLKTHARTLVKPADMRKLCEAPNVSTLAGKMHRALLLTLASSGLRISEAVTLKPEQIWRRSNDYVVYITGKTDTTPRQVPISSEAHAAIHAWLAARPVASEWIFTSFTGRGDRQPSTKHINAISAWQMVQRYAQRVGLAHVKPHDFRRFVGTQLAKVNPRQAQKALGHKDINTTYEHYVLDELDEGLTENLF